MRQQEKQAAGKRSRFTGLCTTVSSKRLDGFERMLSATDGWVMSRAEQLGGKGWFGLKV